MVSFYAFPEIFIDTVTALTTCFEHIFFQKGHPNQKGGCPDTLDTPWIRHCSRNYVLHRIRPNSAQPGR